MFLNKQISLKKTRVLAIFVGGNIKVDLLTPQQSHTFPQIIVMGNMFIIFPGCLLMNIVIYIMIFIDFIQYTSRDVGTYFGMMTAGIQLRKTSSKVACKGQSIFC